MHSSRMRTTRLLSVSPSMHCSRGCTWSQGGLGVYLVSGGVPGPGGCTWFQGVYLVPGGCTWFQGECTWFKGSVPSLGVPAQVLPPVNRMTDRQV